MVILAHRMNTGFTAAVLLRVTSVVNDLLSAVFTGSQRFGPENLGMMYKIRKSRTIAAFRAPCWIGRQWSSLPYRWVLPGIENHSHKSGVRDIFFKETTVSEDPAEFVKSS